MTLLMQPFAQEGQICLTTMLLFRSVYCEVIKALVAAATLQGQVCN